MGAEATETPEPDVALDETQQRAVEMVMSKHFCIISGGPGTGKTRTLRAVVQRLMAEGSAVSIVGPTAKSCAMISKSLGKNTKIRPHTIHKVIYDTTKIKSMRNTCVIVDEGSMVSVELLHDFLFELWNDSYFELEKLVLVGDADQFDPVDGMRMFRDLMAWKRVPRVVFEKSYRFGDSAALAQNIHRLRHDTRVDPATFAQDDSFVYENLPNNDAAYVARIAALFENVSEYTSAVQVICLTGKMRKQLNTTLQAALNKSEPFAFGVRVNDPVVCYRNYYQGDDLIVNNGACGFARIIGGKKCVVYETVDEDGQPKTYTDTQNKNRFATRFALNYARTAHSAQGDECDQAVIVLDIHNFTSVDRSAPYTAITRAKKKCVVFANRELFMEVTSKRPVEGALKQILDKVR